MGHCPSSEAHNKNSASKEILRILLNTKGLLQLLQEPTTFFFLEPKETGPQILTLLQPIFFLCDK
jgi:hypothetical protein